MKSINSRITIIIIGGLLLQMIMLGSLYRFIISRQILSSVNSHETSRQEILQNAVMAIEKSGRNMESAEEILNKYARKHDVEFQIKDLDNNIIVSSEVYRKTNRNIEEMAFIRFNKKPEYILTLNFPLKLRNLSTIKQSRDMRLFNGIIVFAVSSLVSFLIYKVLAVPVKKLKRAMEQVDYGNTLVSIPYHGDDELGELCRKFEDMGSRLKKSEENQTELIQAISHDLKTPLTSISGYIQRLIDNKVTSDEKRREYYEIIHRKSKDVKELLDELDEYASINVPSKYVKNEVELKNFYLEACSELAPEVSQGGGKLSFTFSGGDNIFVKLDSSKIRRVFRNIVENSIKYAGESCTIDISCSMQGKEAVFDFCDNGIGVPEEQCEKIFDRFYRVDSSRSREMGGTGLGLAICRGIVEAHGGKIWAKYREGGGMCICFTLPTL